jgi:hypothetical protein
VPLKYWPAGQFKLGVEVGIGVPTATAVVVGEGVMLTVTKGVVVPGTEVVVETGSQAVAPIEELLYPAAQGVHWTALVTSP